MLSRFWRDAVKLYVESTLSDRLTATLRSGQGSFEDQMNARAMLTRPRPERALQTLVCRETRAYPRFDAPDIDFKAVGLNRDVRRGLFAAGNLGDAVLLAYGYDCAPRRASFGPWGNLAHLTQAALSALGEARRRSHRRQRNLDEYLEQLVLRFRHGDDDAVGPVTSIAKGCETLLDEADKRFMRGARTEHARAA